MASSPAVQPSSIMARARVRIFLREQIKDQDRVVLADLTDRAIAFAMDDKNTMQQLLSELLKPMVHDLAQKVVAETRAGTTPIIVQGGDLVSLTGAVTERRSLLRPRFQAWLEYDGVCHTRLMRMTAEQLKAAARQRLIASRKERAVAQLWVDLASTMPEGGVVEDHYTVEEIEERYIKVIEETA